MDKLEDIISVLVLVESSAIQKINFQLNQNLYFYPFHSEQNYFLS